MEQFGGGLFARQRLVPIQTLHGIARAAFPSANAILQLRRQARLQFLDILPVIQRYTLHQLQAIDQTRGNVASAALTASASFCLERRDCFVDRAAPILIEFAEAAQQRQSIVEVGVDGIENTDD